MFVRTERLLLRPAWREDGAVLASTIAAELSFGDLGAVAGPSVYVASAETRLPRLLVFLRGGNGPELIGAVSLERTSGAEVELVYWISRAHRGKGFATEAAKAVVLMASEALRLNKLVAWPNGGDAASLRVLEKLGFRPARVPAALGPSGRAAAKYERRAPARLFDSDFNQLARAA